MSALAAAAGVGLVQFSMRWIDSLLISVGQGGFPFWTRQGRDPWAIAYIVGRYGDWVLLDPPFKLATAALWGGPAALILIAAAAVAVSLRRRGRPSAAAPLSPAERARLDRLLEDDREGAP